jgi:hypothetical protein
LLLFIQSRSYNMLNIYGSLLSAQVTLQTSQKIKKNL